MGLPNDRKKIELHNLRKTSWKIDWFLYSNFLFYLSTQTLCTAWLIHLSVQDFFSSMLIVIIIFI